MTSSEALRGSLLRPIPKRYFGSRSESKRIVGPFRKPEGHSSFNPLVQPPGSLSGGPHGFGNRAAEVGAAFKRRPCPRSLRGPANDRRVRQAIIPKGFKTRRKSGWISAQKSGWISTQNRGGFRPKIGVDFDPKSGWISTQNRGGFRRPRPGPFRSRFSPIL
jgi:hypothetical protein